MMLTPLIALQSAAGLGDAPVAGESPDWAVKKLRFSALSIGVAMKDHKTGWSSFTNGAGGIKITKTTDGGDTWSLVKNQSNALMIMGMDESKEATCEKGPCAPRVVTTGMLGTEYSSDGDTFARSAFGPFVSQSIRSYADGRVVAAHDHGVCLSADFGKRYKCVKVAELTTLGRYAAAPSADVIYLTAGMWPSSSLHNKTTADGDIQLSADLRITRRAFAAGGEKRVAVETGAPADADAGAASRPPLSASGYTAQIVKSADGGKTWSSCFADSGNFYFNGIDCADEAHCVAVGEGFGRDGSASPGARVYATTDGGQTWALAHHEAVDGSSLMAAKMLSAREYVVGGRLAKGLSLHSADGGKTYETRGAAVHGQMITAMSFVTPTHAFATAVNQLQICSLLEFGTAP